MKYLRTYENLNSPQIGDYVKVNSSKFPELANFFDNEIGKIFKITNDKSYPYEIIFDKSIAGSTYGPEDTTMAFSKVELLGWSSNVKDLEIKINTNKYNL